MNMVGNISWSKGKNAQSVAMCGSIQNNLTFKTK